jgi:hypothetical protein
MQNSSKKIKEHAEQIYNELYEYIENSRLHALSGQIDEEKVMEIATQLAEDAYSDAMEVRAELRREMREEATNE